MDSRDNITGLREPDSLVNAGRHPRHAVYVLIIVAGLAAAAIGWYLTQQHSTDTVTSSNPDLVLLSTDHSHSSGACGPSAITGVIGNRGRSAVGHLRVDIALLDADGAEIGTAYASADRLEPGAVWSFSAPPIGSGVAAKRVFAIADR
jgi:hypothetical protein